MVNFLHDAGHIFLQILFPVLQKLVQSDEHSGHYFLIVLNLRNKRFEVLDSMRNLENGKLAECCNKITNAIKSLWKIYYPDTKNPIDKYEMVMTSYRPAVFSSARTAGLIHRTVDIQRSRVARATRAPDKLAPPYTTGEEFCSKHRVSRRSFRLPYSLSRVPLYPLYPLESPLDSPTHRRASSDP